MGELTDREIKVFFEEGILYGIFVGGELGGYIHSLTSSKKTAVLDQFFVHSDHRGRVVGTHTLKLYEKLSRSKGIRTYIWEPYTTTPQEGSTENVDIGNSLYFLYVTRGDTKKLDRIA